ncbi:hypothetical protein MTO96_044277 [Rhipicephalus appendiculatus]
MWTALVACIPHSLVRLGCDQMAVQRFMAARTAREAKRTVSSVVNSHAATIYLDVMAPYIDLSGRRAVVLMHSLGCSLGKPSGVRPATMARSRQELIRCGDTTYLLWNARSLPIERWLSRYRQLIIFGTCIVRRKVLFW